MEPVLCVDGEVGVRFKFGNDFPIVISQHSFRMVRLQACPGEAVQRHSMTAKGMPQAVVRPLNSRPLNGVRHGNRQEAGQSIVGRVGERPVRWGKEHAEPQSPENVCPVLDESSA
jgi:hypothetical protein